MTSEDAASIRADLAAVYQGLMATTDTMTNILAIVSAIHDECCKDPPPSKIPAALAKLTVAVQSLEATVRARG